MGTTFIDGFIVAELEDQLNGLEVDRTKDRNTISALDAQIVEIIALEEVFANEAIATLFSRRLVDVPVLVVADRGVEVSAVENLQIALIASGARYEGILWVEEQMDISVDGNRLLLAETLGLNDRNSSRVEFALQSALRREFAVDGPAKVAAYAGRFGIQLGGEILSGGIDSVEHLAATPSTVRLLTRLERGDFIEWDKTGMNPELRPYAPLLETRILLISSADSLPGADALLRPLLLEMQRSSPVPIVVVDTEAISSDGLGLGAELRSGAPLHGTVSTVKELGSFEGVAAAVLALDGIFDFEPANWGHGDDSDAVLPPPARSAP